MTFERKRRPGRVMVTTPERGSLDVRAIRLAARGIGATQQCFANAIGIPVKTLRNWEQGRRQPTGPARVLLSLVERDSWLVFDVSSGQHQCFDGYGRPVPIPGSANPDGAPLA